jgi:methionine-rich copper-binding protein CopC
MSTKARINVKAGLAAGVLLGLLSQQAAAHDEVVVYGAEAAARARATEALFEAQMHEYVQRLGVQLKASMEEGLKVAPKPRLRLAASELPTRG